MPCSTAGVSAAASTGVKPVDGSCSDGPEVEHGQRPVHTAEQAEFGAVAEDRAHAEAGEPGQRGLGPLLRVGAADRSGQDRHALAGQPGRVNGRDEVRGRLADQADRPGLRLVEDAGRDALGTGVDLRPRVPRPGVSVLVEDHQVVS